LGYLKKNGKKVILIKSGNIAYTLKKQADILINAQSIKHLICSVKNTKKRIPPQRNPDIGPASAGRVSRFTYKQSVYQIRLKVKDFFANP
jgi:hypothetical protein